MKNLMLAVAILLSSLSFATITEDTSIRTTEEITQTERKHTERMVTSITRGIETGQLALRTNHALDTIIHLAVWKLRRNGFTTEADDLEADWMTNWFGAIIRVRDLGDYAPLSKWLSEVYLKIADLLGPEVVKWLHFDDIQIINYSIPVIFRPCNEQWDRSEYQMHFVPFAGVITYWSVYLSCGIGTAGIGSVFFCSPLGMLGEHLMERFAAPPLSNVIWDAACNDTGFEFTSEQFIINLKIEY